MARLQVLTVAAAVLLASCADGGSAAVQPARTPTPSEGGTELMIVLTEDDGATPRGVTLTCDPPGGDHPDPAAACAALDAAGGVAAFEPVPKDVACTEIYGGPQTAHVTGTVRGTPVDAAFSRVNGCEIARWDALAPLLGSAGGV